jgi:hypothetical protein
MSTLEPKDVVESVEYSIVFKCDNDGVLYESICSTCRNFIYMQDLSYIINLRNNGISLYQMEVTSWYVVGVH